MRLLKELLSLREMTMRFDTESDLNSSFTYVGDEINKNGKYIGSFNGLKIYSCSYNGTMLYGIYEDGSNEMFAYVSTSEETIKDIPFIVLNTMYVSPKFQNKGAMTKFIYFLLNHQKKSLISYGVVSDKSFGLYNSLATKKFDVRWFNIETGETHDIKNLNNKFGDFTQTEWKIAIFNNIKYPLPMVEGSGHPMAGLWKIFEDSGP